MSLGEIIFLAIALGIDCLVVSFSQGLIYLSNRIKNSFALALTMGLLQGLMSCAGYFFAETVARYVSPFSNLIVFIIFILLGIKFITDAFIQKEQKICCINFKCLISMGIATSIDALAAGASLGFSSVQILKPAIIIGIMSFIMSITGFWFAIFFKKLPSKYLEIFGGIILIILGIKAFLV